MYQVFPTRIIDMSGTSAKITGFSAPSVCPFTGIFNRAIASVAYRRHIFFITLLFSFLFDQDMQNALKTVIAIL